MSKKRCCGVVAPVSPCGGLGIESLCSNPICAIIALIILQKTCLLENNNAFLLILIFLGICCCRRPVAAVAATGCGCGR